ncbi:hypothetical protein TRIATDRAFT_298030 [Trichoderma atroviride IMI 206040]|uniref:Uncharacterized protein n=1 Tax=Hypocrea atroviridis (strain ATCC 20476 / IMI 206040) TaxID=452589 RepID=G9NL18_HYPAI|nr:uncharacterized protein TRIATDRAFT_298030 [Trichoderma atroviride IMI 206040]EHK48586.1 hypothetical protein TRIATDRAFT_298030 [Trichoderma atroviride IMI 206040]
MRRESLAVCREGRRASIHFSFFFILLNPHFLFAFDNPIIGQCGRKMSRDLHVTTTNISYTSNIMAGVLEFIGSHIIIFSFSFTVIIIPFIFSFYSPGWRQARHENTKQTNTSISQCVCVDRREGRDVF